MRRFTNPVTRLLGPVVALLAVSALALGACSGDSKDSSEKSSTTSSSTTTTTFKFAGDDSKAWCEADRRLQKEFAAMLQQGSTAEQGQARFKATIDALDELHAKASDEIRPAVATIRDAYRAAGPALAKAGYDPNKLPAKYQKLLSSEKAQQASDRLGAYERQVCKYDPSKEPTSGSTPSNGSTPTTGATPPATG